MNDLTLSGRPILITDHTVDQLYGNLFDCQKLSVPPGELSKTRETKQMLEDQLLLQGFGRDTTVIALGGGVILDLVGFLASTYCRGVPYIAIPTTLLAMVDASIGGKTAVNTPFGKNMIGSFAEPVQTIVDRRFLETLSDVEKRCGIAEIIKHGCIADQRHFLDVAKGTLPIERSRQIKQEIVEKDRREKGVRAHLNFGHTVGHAIELLSDYTVRHGEAVALGMIAESHLARLEGYLETDTCDLIVSTIRSFFPKCTIQFEGEALFRAMRLDKKAKNNIPHFVMLSNIGDVRGVFPAKEEKILDALSFIAFDTKTAP